MGDGSAIDTTSSIGTEDSPASSTTTPVNENLSAAHHPEQQLRSFKLSNITNRRGSQSPEKTIVRPEETLQVEKLQPPSNGIMEDSLADVSPHLERRDSASQSQPSSSASDNRTTILASARMEDSLDIDYMIQQQFPNHGMANDALREAIQIRDSHEARQKKTLDDAVNANEVFNDPGAMDFLENAGSKSGVLDSELARQSLFQKFDPFVGKPTLSIGKVQEGTQDQSKPEIAAAHSPAPAGSTTFRQPYPTQSHTATTGMIAAMQQKQNAIKKQQQQTVPTDRLSQPTSAPFEQALSQPTPQPHSSWPDLVTRRDINNAAAAPFATMKLHSSPHPHVILPHAPPARFSSPHPYNSMAAAEYERPVNGGGDYYRSPSSEALQVELDLAENPDDQLHTGPPGSLVNFGLTEDETPRRPVTLRTKFPGSSTATKSQNRRSVPAGFLDGREGIAAPMTLEPQEEYTGLQDLPPVWENVMSTYEGLVRVLVGKLHQYKEESSMARQNESKAIKEREEMHKVFVGLHERFENSKLVIMNYQKNQETMQRAFDELNADFQPIQQDNKRMQAAMRLNEMRMRQLEADLAKKSDENAELTKIVDDLISKDS